MPTLTEELPDVVTTVVTEDDPDAPDKHKHYFGKADLDRNLFDGAAIVAMCGFVKVGLAHPNPNLPLCPKCDAWWKSRDE